MTGATLLQPGFPAERVPVEQGQIQYGTDPRTLVTILGSCVAVCLWDHVRHLGGMNHFVLPSDPRGGNNARYGYPAIDELVAGLLRLGCRIGDLQAKVFGGAAVLPSSGGESVGSTNVRIALERLRHYGIPVTAQRTGGTLGQQIRFDTATGAVCFRLLRRSTQNTEPADPRRTIVS